MKKLIPHRRHPGRRRRRRSGVLRQPRPTRSRRSPRCKTSRGSIVDARRRHRHAAGGHDRHGRHAGLRHRPEPRRRRLQLDREEGPGRRAARSLDSRRRRSRPAKANLTNANANLERQRVAVADAQPKLTRAKELNARQLINKVDLENAEVTVKSAEAQLKSTQSSIVQAEAVGQQGQGRPRSHGDHRADRRHHHQAQRRPRADGQRRACRRRSCSSSPPT